MEPFPVYPGGKSRDVVSGKTGSGKKFYHTLSEQQLLVCGKVDSACNDEFMDNAFAFCREKMAYARRPVTVTSQQGAVARIRVAMWTSSRKCHWTQRRVHRRRANSDVGSGMATRVYRHQGTPVLISIARRCGSVLLARSEGKCGNVRPILASNPHSYPSLLCAQLLPCLQSSCALVHLQPTMILMVDGFGSRPTLKTSHVTLDRRETG